MTYKEYLAKNEDIVKKASEFKKTIMYKQIQDFIKTPQYKQALLYLQKIDNEVHKDILKKIEFLQIDLVKKMLNHNKGSKGSPKWELCND